MRATVVEASATVDQLVEDIAAGLVIPGVRRCILRIESPGWSHAWAATTHPDDDGLDADVAFRIASVTKLVTATSLLVLVDRGRCDLDDRAGAHLPAALLDQFRDADGRPYAAALTLRRLLDHTSGLPNYFTTLAVLDAVRHGAGLRRFKPIDLLELAAGAPPPTQSATTSSYTDTGFVLAGLIIESLTGRPLDAAYRDLVLDPAGMEDTWLESSNETPRRSVIAPHDFDGVDLSGMDPTVDWAGGGLVSTASDLAALLGALTRGELVCADAWKAMTQWRPGPAGYYDDYGLGLGRYHFPTATFIGHHGVWGAFAFWSPELELTVTGTVSTARVDRRPLLGEIVKALGHHG